MQLWQWWSMRRFEKPRMWVRSPRVALLHFGDVRLEGQAIAKDKAAIQGKT